MPTETWTPRLDLHIDVDAPAGRNLMVSDSDSSLRNTPPEITAGDITTVRVFFYRRGSSPGTVVPLVLPEGATVRFSGKHGNVLLFLADSFAAGSGDWMESPANFYTSEIADLLAGQDDPSLAVEIRAEIETTINGEIRSLQFPASLRPEVYAGEGTPAGLPSPDENGFVRSFTGAPVAYSPSMFFLRMTANPADGDEFIFDGITYVFRSTAAGSEVQIGSTNMDTAQNLAEAINSNHPRWTCEDPTSAPLGNVDFTLVSQGTVPNVTTVVWETTAPITYSNIEDPHDQGTASSPGKPGDMRFTSTLGYVCVALDENGHTIWRSFPFTVD